MKSMKIQFAKLKTMHYIFPWLYRWTDERSVADWAIYKSSCKKYFQQSSALKRQIKADNVDADGIYPLDVFCLHSLSGIGVPWAECSRVRPFFCYKIQIISGRVLDTQNKRGENFMKFERPLPAEPSNGMEADGNEYEEKNNDSWDETIFWMFSGRSRGSLGNSRWTRLNS